MNNFEERLNISLENWGSLSFLDKAKTVLSFTALSLVSLAGFIGFMGCLFFMSEIFMALSR